MKKSRLWLLLVLLLIAALTSIVYVQGKTVSEVQEYADVRNMNLSRIDFTVREDLIATLWFNQQTKWPKSAKSLKNNPEWLLQTAMNPGLGLKELHDQGITGQGITVAIIDQPLYLDHPEFAGKIAAYKDFNCQSENSMHGPAVTSLLAGDRIGTAPGVKIYYAAVPSWLQDASYYARALDWIVAENRKLPAETKIRVVSVSSAPSGQGSPFTKNNDAWDKSCTQAEQEGIIVLDCTSHRGIIDACWYDFNNPEAVELCRPGYPGSSGFVNKNKLLAPTSPRTSAEEYQKGHFGYQYTGRGGLSWGIPYVAGVLALGWQLRPDLTPEEMEELLFKTAYVRDGYQFINPREFVKAVKELKE